MKKKQGISLKSVLAFIVTFLIYHLAVGGFFPVDENNVLQAPDWYPILGIAISIIVTTIVSNYKKIRGHKLYFKDFIKFAHSKAPTSEEDLVLRNSETQTVPTSIDKTPLHFTEIFNSSVMIVFETGQASISILQSKLKIGYAKAARLIDEMEEFGIVGPFQGSKPREILLTKDQYIEKVKNKELKKLYPEEQPESISFSGEIDFEEIIKDEQDWRREQSGLSFVDFELNRIDSMEGHEFEHWCAKLLKKNGFTDVKVTKGSGDQGVDVLATKDGIKYAIQCKCYSSNLGNTPVQEVNAGKTMYGCQIGVVMTNRYFTSGAKDLAKATGVLLWDRDKLKSFLDMAE